MHKKYTFIGLVVSALLLGGALPFVASAQTLSIDELRAKISELMAQIATLKTELGERGATPSADTAVSTTPGVGSVQLLLPHRACERGFDRNLSVGMQGDDVKNLQEFLRSKKYLSAEATGYFGPLTSLAVTKWQSNENVPALGLFGPLSRERMKRVCESEWSDDIRALRGAPTNGGGPLTVTFKTRIGGLRDRSVSYSIDFGDGTNESPSECLAPADACIEPGINTHTYTKDGTYTAVLYKTTDPCLGNTMCMAPVQREKVGSVIITVGSVSCTKEYAPACGSKPIMCITTPCNPIEQTYSNTCMMKADGATFLYAGSCRTVTTTQNPEDNPQCKAWFDGCNSCGRTKTGEPAMCTLRACTEEVTVKPYCTEYFDSKQNRAPVVSSFTGPTTLSVNTTGTWSVTASDPENASLTYSITWGDELASLKNTLDLLGSAPRAEQITTFTHEYEKSGTYTVTILVRDSAGKEAKTTATVTVTAKACGELYAPVCGRPTGCANSCPKGMYCTMVCKLPEPVTYSSECLLESAGASKLHEGVCTQSSGATY